MHLYEGQRRGTIAESEIWQSDPEILGGAPVFVGTREAKGRPGAASNMLS